jgi:hypothetical protein
MNAIPCVRALVPVLLALAGRLRGGRFLRR